MNNFFRFFCFSLLLSFPTYATELSPKTIMLNGQLGISFQSYSKSGIHQSRFSFGVFPEVGIFVIKNFSIGPRFGYKFQQTKNKTTGSVSTGLSNGLLIGPSFNYFFGLSQKTFVSIGASPALSFSDQRFVPDISKTKYEIVAADISAGPSLHFFLNYHLALQLGVLYNGQFGTERIRILGVVQPGAQKYQQHGFLFQVGFSGFLYKNK